MAAPVLLNILSFTYCMVELSDAFGSIDLFWMIILAIQNLQEE